MLTVVVVRSMRSANAAVAAARWMRFSWCCSRNWRSRLCCVDAAHPGMTAPRRGQLPSLSIQTATLYWLAFSSATAANNNNTA
jgi:hypothetical protein